MKTVSGAKRLAGLGLATLLLVLSSVAPSHADSTNDQALLTQLGLIRGHLHMASELTDAGDKKNASVHFHHPLKELYSAIAPELAARDIPDLGDKLRVLEKADEAGGDLKKPLGAVLSTIDLAEASITASPKLMLAAVVGLLRHAAEEYQAAYQQGTLDKLEEYQDSAGFARKAAEIFARIRLNLSKRDPPPIRDIALAVATLQTAWPSLNGPAKPIIDAAGVKALVDKIEQRAAAYRG